MKLDISEIEACFKTLIEHVRARGIEGVDSSKYDEYWMILSQEKTDFDRKPNMAVGSFRDDIAELRELLSERSRASVVDLERLSSVLCLLARTIEDNELYVAKPAP